MGQAGKGKKEIAAMVKDHEELKAAVADMDNLVEMTKSRMSFLEKQAEDLNKEIGKRKREFWNRIEAYLTQQGLLPTYDRKKQHLQYEVDLGVICTCDCQGEEEALGGGGGGGGMPTELRQILKKFGLL